MMNDNASMRVSKELQEIARELDGRLADVAGERVSFSLFVYTDKLGSYVSNSNDRETIKKVLQQIIDGWAQGKTDIPAHELN